MKSGIAVLLLLVLSIFGVSPVNGSFNELNAFLNPIIMGVDPGPCPSQADWCAADLETLPRYIKDVQICLIGPICGKLGNLLQSGELYIWNLQCRDISITDIDVTAPTSNNNQNIDMDFNIDGVKISCTGRLRFTDLKIGIGNAFIRLNGEENFSFNARDQGSGNYVDFRLQTKSPDFTQLRPTQFFLPEDQCRVSLDTGLKLPIEDTINIDGCLPIFGVSVCGDITFLTQYIVRGDIVEWVVWIVEGFLGGIICQVVNQFGYLDNGDPGVLNVFLNEFNTLVNQYTDSPPDDVRTLEDNILDFVTAVELNNALKFDDNIYVEIGSDVVNTYLGSPSNTPSYNNRPAVNELIDLVTTPNGQISLDFLKYDLQAALDVYLLTVGLQAKSISLAGLSSISRLNVLQNNYEVGFTPADRFKFTFNNEFTITDLFIRVEVNVNLDDGLWTNDVPATDLAFTLDLPLGEILVTFQTLVVANPDELNNLILGQIFENDSIENIIQCIAPALYHFALPSVTANINVKKDGVVVGGVFDQDFTDMINDVTRIVLDILDGFMANDVEDILQGPVRELVNEFIAVDLLGPGVVLDSCTAWTGVDDGSYFQFNTELGKNLIGVVNDAIGGTPIIKSSVDVNELLNIALESIATRFDSPIQNAGSIGDWDYIGDGLLFQGGLEFQTSTATSFSVDKLQIRGVDSIYNLNFEFALPLAVRIQFAMGGGCGDDSCKIYADQSKTTLQEVDPLSFQFEVAVTVQELQIEDTFTISVELKQLLIDLFAFVQVFFYDVYSLQVFQLYEPLCYASLISYFRLVLNEVKVGLVDVDIIDRNIGKVSSFTQALNQLQTDLNQARGGESFSAMFEYIAEGVLRRAFDVAVYNKEDNDQSFQDMLDNCATASFEIPEDSLLGTVLDAFGSTQYQDILDFITRSLAGQPNAVDPALTAANEANVVLPPGASFINFNDNIITNLLQDLLADDADNPNPDEFSLDVSNVLNEIIKVAANTTGNIISDSLYLKEVNGIDVAVLKVGLSDFGFDGDYLEIGDFIPGFYIDADIEIAGINQFDTFDILAPMEGGRFTTRHKVKYSENFPLQIKIDINFSVDEAFTDRAVPEGLRTIDERLTLEFEVSDVGFYLQTMTAIDLDALENITLGHFLSVDENQVIGLQNQFLSCIFSAVFENGLNLPELVVLVQNFEQPVITTDGTLISPGIVLMISEVINIVTTLWLEYLPNFTQGELRKFINSVLEDISKDENACVEQPLPVLPPGKEAFNFQTSEQLQFFQSFMNEIIAGDEDNYNLLNNLIDNAIGQKTFFNSKDGDEFWLTPENSTFPIFWEGVTYGSFGLRISDIKLRNIKFTDVSLLEPVGPYSLDNSAQLSGPIELSVNIYLVIKDFFTSNDEIANEFNLKVIINDLSLAGNIDLEVLGLELMQVRLGGLSNLEQLPCLFTAIQAFTIRELDLAFSSIGLAYQCNGLCEFAMLKDETEYQTDAATEAGLTDVANQVVAVFVEYFTSNEFQRIIDDTLRVAPQTCAYVLGYITELIDISDQDDVVAVTDLFTIVAIVGFVGGLGLSIPFLLRKHKVQRHKHRLEHNLQVMEGAGESGKAAVTKYMNAKRGGKKANTEEMRGLQKELLIVRQMSMYQHPVMHRIAKVLLPLLCFINIGVMMYAVSSTDVVSIVLSVDVLGDTTETVTVVTFTLFRMINDLWTIGIWPMSIGLALFSCIWPIVKSMLLIYVFFAPATVCSKRQGDWLLFILEVIGKTVYVEVYIIVLVINGFLFKLQAGDVDELEFIKEGFLGGTLNSEPGLGTVLIFSSATLIHLINHVMHFYHRYIVDMDQLIKDEIENVSIKPTKFERQRTAVWNHTFTGGTRWMKNIDVQFPAIAKKGILYCLLFSALFQFAASFVPIFTYTYLGVVGLVITAIDTKNGERTLSIFTMGATVTEAELKTSASMLFAVLMTAIFYTTTILAPLCYSVFSIVMWTLPTTLKEKKLIYQVTLIAGYWTALEIFLLILVGGTLLIEPYLLFIIDDLTFGLCGDVQPALEVVLGEANGYCLNTVLSFATPAFLVFAATAVQATLCVLTAGLTKTVIDDMEYKNRLLKGDIECDVPRRPHWWIRIVFSLFFDTARHRAFAGRSGTAAKTELGKVGEDRINKWKSNFGLENYAQMAPHSGNPAASNPIFNQAQQAGRTPRLSSIDV